MTVSSPDQEDFTLAASLGTRGERVRRRMGLLGLDVLLLSLGADLPWLTGYQAMPLERLTMLVLPQDTEATLVVPRLEAARVARRPELFALRPWEETEDPVAIVASLVGDRARIAISDRTWSTFLLSLQRALPAAEWQAASTVTAPLRAVKDAAEVGLLRRAAEAADRVAEALVAGEIALVGRTEAEVALAIGRRLRDEGHERVNFVIVGSGPNSASPHHEPGSRRIRPGEAVVCDFGGTREGYCSDITRTVFTGEPPPEFLDLYAVLREAQALAVGAATVGVACADVDSVARAVISGAGYGRELVHRTGHGIGLEEHEEPYLVAGNAEPLAAGHVFSVEPGIYVEGRWGARIEDIVVATDRGPDSLNRVDRSLAVVG